MSVHAVVEIRLNPDASAQAQQTLRDALQKTRDFAGCQRVDLMFDESDSSHAFVIETWDSPEADTAYRAWRDSPDGASPGLAEILAAPPTVCTGSFDTL